MSYMILTIAKVGDLPKERESVDTFADARKAADAYLEEGVYAAGVKQIIHGRPSWAWRYLTTLKHGVTEPKLADRSRKKQTNPILPMEGIPVA